MAESATAAKPDPKPGSRGTRSRSSSGASASPTSNQLATPDEVDLVKTLTEAVQKSVSDAKHVTAKKAGYGRLVSGKKTLAYVKPRKRGGITVDVAKGHGSYDKVTVEDEKGIGSVASRIADVAKKGEPVGAAS